MKTINDALEKKEEIKMSMGDRVKLILVKDIGREDDKIVGEYEYITADHIL